jgi:integrase
MARTTGIRTRHGRACRLRDGGSCSCHASYEAWVYDRRSGQKIRKTFPTISAAKGWRADALGEVRRGKLRPASPTTVREAWEEWHAGATAGAIRKRGGGLYKPSVLRSYKTSMERRVLDELGAVRLGEITRFDLQALVDRWLGEGLDASTIRNGLMPLRCVYRHALKRGMVAFSPLAELELPAVTGKREWTRTAEDALLLIAAAPEQDRALWATAFLAGPRRGELMALDHEDVGTGSLHIRRSWDMREGFVDTKSTAGVRSIPVPRLLLDELLDHRRRTRPAGLVFGRSPTRPFEPVSVQARADKAWAEHGLERVTLHIARHAYSSFLAAAGIPKERRDWYRGHADPSMDARYTHALPGQLAADAELLNAYLTGAQTGAQAPEPAPLSESGQDFKTGEVWQPQAG